MKDKAVSLLSFSPLNTWLKGLWKHYTDYSLCNNRTRSPTLLWSQGWIHRHTQNHWTTQITFLLWFWFGVQEQSHGQGRAGSAVHDLGAVVSSPLHSYYSAQIAAFCCKRLTEGCSTIFKPFNFYWWFLELFYPHGNATQFVTILHQTSFLTLWGQM